MKKNFLSELKVDNSFYVYENYGFKGDQFFLENEINAIFYEGFAPTKIIPLNKNLPIKDLFIKGQLYGENQHGQVVPIETEEDEKKCKKKAAYLVATEAITDPKENYLKTIFPINIVTNEYNLNVFGRTLYTELAKSDFSNFHEIINFSRTWGLPTGVSISDLEVRVPEIKHNFIWMSLDDFYKKNNEYQRTFSYFKALNTNDFSKLPTKPEKGEHEKGHAARMLEKEMEEKSVFSFKIEGKGENQTFITVFDDLFQAAFFYLKLSINSNAEMRLCENCGHLFEVTHQRQRFCSVLPGRKRSSCEMAYNNRSKKEKKKQGEI